ncbi:S8 family serine peptidase [Paracoccus lutimaris]|uniref:Serine protease n=1 Tax=Paracoccus lutimaris TaxID=1490030 RepID=A0A368Z421_9RHOB|nr:S8 family serine peptidase [Paracoccus lutimaris]RCW87203.1 trypsin-like peptidase [Paracoccus lutimaris]
MTEFRGLALLREIMRDAAPDDRPIFTPERMRFVLELLPSDDPAEAQARTREKLKALTGSTAFRLEPLFPGGDPAFLVFSPEGIDRTLPEDAMFAIAEALRDQLGLLSCEPDIGVAASSDPSDSPPRGTEGVIGDIFCWAQGNAPPDKEWALRRTLVHQAWARNPAKGRNIVIAQPDTGIVKHVELQDTRIDLSRTLNLIEGGTDPTDPLSSRMSNPGHGTSTASVVASGEGSAIKGSAPRATLVPIRCINDVVVMDASPVARAVDHAIGVGAHVVTMSLGGLSSRALRAAIRRAVARDIIVMAAAGNCVGITVWPAAFPECIAVAGTNNADQPWRGTSRGPSIDFSAPAEFVWRADTRDPAHQLTGISGGQGTSFAVALSAGIAALWLGHHGRAAAIAEARRRGTTLQDLFRAAARQTARRPAGFPGDMGAGIINADALLALSLRDIRMGGLESAIAATDLSGGLEGAMTEVLGPGRFDEGFDWARHGAEVSALLIADARAGRGQPGAGAEARAPRRASGPLTEAAAGARDPRLAALALRAGMPAPALLRPAESSLRTEALITRIGVAASPGISAESARKMNVETARAALDESGRAQILDGLNARIEQTGRNDLGTDLDSIDDAIRNLHSQGGAARLSTAQTIQLEALVSLTDRAALPVTERLTPDNRIVQTVDSTHPSLGAFGVLVNTRLSDLESGPLAAVGRIDADWIHTGTGFLVGPDLILTNRHVLEELASPLPRATNPARWQMTRQATIDFSPSGFDPARRFRIVEVVLAGPDPITGHPISFEQLDLALLRIETTNTSGGTPPAPIAVVRNEGWRARAANLFVVGYPAPPAYIPRDDQGALRQDVIERLRELFGLRYREKYFAPGMVQRFGGWVFDHDATTLGGNSGSLIGTLEGVDISAAGLHFAGDWLRANHAHDLALVRAANSQLNALL